MLFGLGKLDPGTLFFFADSGNFKEDPLEALTASEENIFMVFTDESNKSEGEEIDIVSLDGKVVLRRSSSRMVRKVGEPSFHEGGMATGRAMLSKLESGTTVFTRTSFLMVSKASPSPKGKVVLFSTMGEKIVEDEDLLVQYYPDAYFQVDLAFA